MILCLNFKEDVRQTKYNIWRDAVEQGQLYLSADELSLSQHPVYVTISLAADG